MTARTTAQLARALSTALLLLLALCLFHARTALAHEVGLSRGQYALRSDVLDARLTFDGDELGVTSDPVGAGRGLALPSPEARAALHARIVDRIHVRDRRGLRCPGTLESVEPLERGGVSLRAAYRCAGPIDPSSVELELWSELAPGHRHLASAAGRAEQLLYRERPQLDLRPSGATGEAAAETATEPGAAAEPGAAESTPLSPLAWVQLGVEHIIGGYDHLLFLLALLLVTPGLRTLAATVSVFTLAHSVTLALSTLDLFAPPPSLVECAIALSITYVGLENLTERAARPRYAIVFTFGLIHGFGFAGALAELGLPAARTPVPLLSFNLGVELGQLAVIAIAYPVVRALSRTPWFVPRGVTALSLCTALAGMFWFIERV